MGALALTAERTEVSAAAQVSGGIDLLHPTEWTMGRRQKIGIPRTEVLGLRAPTMTPVAVGLGVDDVAAQSNQSFIPSFKIERHRRDLKTYPDLVLIPVVVRFRPRTDAWSLDGH